MIPILDGLTFVSRELAKKDQESAKQEAENLLCCVTNCDRASLYFSSGKVLSENEWKNCQVYLQRRLQGEPLAYIHGSIEFYDCLIRVNPSVLIPRQETEILVDKISADLSQQKNLAGKILWDLCCGSGCIGIALKKKFPQLKVISSDLSLDALSVARLNAKLNEVEVEFVQGDLLTPFLGQRANYVVCNPPYISESEYQVLDSEVREFEPKLALVGGVSGLEIYERLAKVLPFHLYTGAKVWLEIGYLQGNILKKVFQNVLWKKMWFENDWAGHHRFFFLENE
jgi:release factor glutamine methyltransferase